MKEYIKPEINEEEISIVDIMEESNKTTYGIQEDIRNFWPNGGK